MPCPPSLSFVSFFSLFSVAREVRLDRRLLCAARHLSSSGEVPSSDLRSDLRSHVDQLSRLGRLRKVRSDDAAPWTCTRSRRVPAVACAPSAGATTRSDDDAPWTCPAAPRPAAVNAREACFAAYSRHGSAQSKLHQGMHRRARSARKDTGGTDRAGAAPLCPSTAGTLLQAHKVFSPCH